MFITPIKYVIIYYLIRQANHITDYSLISCPSLLDIAEECDPPHDPVTGPNITLKVYGANIVYISPGWLPVYGALVQAAILSYDVMKMLPS